MSPPLNYSRGLRYTTYQHKLAKLMPLRGLGNKHVQSPLSRDDGVFLPQEYRALTLLDEN